MSQHYCATKSEKYGNVHVTMGWDKLRFTFLTIATGVCPESSEDIYISLYEEEDYLTKRVDGFLEKLEECKINLPVQMLEEIRLEESGQLNATDKTILHKLHSDGSYERIDMRENT